MSIPVGGISYSDLSGITGLGTLHYTSTIGLNTVTTIYGYSNNNGLAPYAWPDYSKTGPEFFRQLVVQFGQTGCGNDLVTVSLPNQLQDGKTLTDCTLPSCSPWLCNTYSASTPINSALISIDDPNTNLNTVTIDPLLTTTFPVNLVLNNNSSLTNHIYIAPDITPAALVSSTGLSFSGGANISLNTPTSLTNFTELTSSNLDFIITIDPHTSDCANQTIALPVGYSCSGNIPTSTATLCGENTAAAIIIKVREPSVSLNTGAGSNAPVFTDSKGTCCGDEKECRSRL
jgi:hypothetical protein